MVSETTGETILMLATYGMEIVECGGAIAKHVRAGGKAVSAVSFARERSHSEVRAAAEILGVSDVRFLGLDYGDLPAGAEGKRIFVRLLREWKPNIVIVQDPEHAFADLDPGRRDIMTVYIEAVALAGREWHIEECGGLPPHRVRVIYYMTPSHPNCVVDVSDVWDVKERAMDALRSQHEFSGEYFKTLMGAKGIKTLAPNVDPEGPADVIGREVHRATDLGFHITHGHHSHSGLYLAEPYRREGVFPFDRLI